MAPVTFLIFNRPKHTAKVFEAIRARKPEQLFIIADGPRPGHAEDHDSCSEARRVVNEGIDWKCEVRRSFADTNMGCGPRVASGLSWVFDQVEETVILEDDCLPDPSFFSFCDDLLERFRDDTRVMMISGDNFQFGKPVGRASYYFSRHVHIWGWATWRRAWSQYDYTMADWPEFKHEGLLRSIVTEPSALRRWTGILDLAMDGHFNTWDYQWMFACWKNNGLSVIPSINLVTNIGCDDSGSHTAADELFRETPRRRMPTPLTHPAAVVPNYEADRFTEQQLGAPYRLTRRLRRKLGKLFALLIPSDRRGIGTRGAETR